MMGGGEGGKDKTVLHSSLSGAATRVGMEVRSWKPIPFSTPLPTSSSVKAGAPKSTRNIGWVVACGLTLFALILVAVFASTMGAATSTPLPTSGVMGMTPAAQKAGSVSRRRRMDDDAEAAGFTQFTCTRNGQMYTPSIDEMSIDFMTASLPGFVTNSPGGNVYWDWKKTDTSEGNVYQFDAPVHLMLSGRSDDVVARSDSIITSHADLVARTSRFVSWHAVNETSTLMGCDSMEEYSSGVDGKYVCGPYGLTILARSSDSDDGFRKSFPLFGALSRFITGGHTRGSLELHANLTESCSMVARFDLGNSNGTNTHFITLKSYDDSDTNTGVAEGGSEWRGPKYSMESGYTERFPGQGWRFGVVNCTDDADGESSSTAAPCWSQPGYTEHHSIWNDKDNEVTAFLRTKIDQSQFPDRDAILAQWGNLSLGSSTDAGKLLNKMHIESYGGLFQDHLQHYIKYKLSGLRKAGTLDDKPTNIDSVLWADMDVYGD